MKTERRFWTVSFSNNVLNVMTTWRAQAGILKTISMLSGRSCMVYIRRTLPTKSRWFLKESVEASSCIWMSWRICDEDLPTATYVRMVCSALHYAMAYFSWIIRSNQQRKREVTWVTITETLARGLDHPQGGKGSRFERADWSFAFGHAWPNHRNRRGTVLFLKDFMTSLPDTSWKCVRVIRYVQHYFWWWVRMQVHK